VNTVPSSFIADLRRRGIADERTLAAMAKVPRQLFVPANLRENAYDDRALPIECRQTISQPYIVAWMTELLQLRGNERVLEIGTGSGYQTAVLAALCREVVTVERHEHLSLQARSRLEQLGFTNVEFHVGDGTLGWPDRAPYDACLVAAASPGVPSALTDQLAANGRLVIPIGSEAEQDMVVVTKSEEGRLSEKSHGGCRFVKLIGEQGWHATADEDP
jgi:protein-L-isoaspartate(D-aspartate) O-methyltransferase